MGVESISDREAFRQMWRAGHPTDAIAEHFRCSSVTVHNTRVKMGLPPRRVWSRQPGKTRTPEIADAGFDPGPILARVEKARAEGRVAMPPFWTWDRDRAVIEAGGRWQKVALLAEKWRMASGQIIARWHLLRAV